jgi:hypothetical protein
MKYVFAFALFLFSCTNDNKSSESVKAFPKPGTVVASAEMPVAGDNLNNFVFSVKVIADSSVTSGVYDVDADFGPNLAVGEFTMPKGGEHFKPLIRIGSEPNTFIIGFRMPGDTAFNDYFEVSSNHAQTKMRYIKAYSLE